MTAMGCYPTMKMAAALACNDCRQVERLKVQDWGGILTGLTGYFFQILILCSKARGLGVK